MRFEETYSARDREIQGADASHHRDANEEITVLARQTPQSLLLRAQHPDERTIELCIQEIVARVVRGANDFRAAFAEAGKGPREIGNRDKRDGGAGSALRYRCSHSHCSVFGSEHGTRSERIGDADARAKIARILHSIESEQKRTRLDLADDLKQIGHDISLPQLRGDSLMPGFARDAIQPGALDAKHPDLTRLRERNEISRARVVPSSFEIYLLDAGRSVFELG